MTYKIRLQRQNNDNGCLCWNRLAYQAASMNNHLKPWPAKKLFIEQLKL